MSGACGAMKPGSAPKARCPKLHGGAGAASSGPGRPASIRGSPIEASGAGSRAEGEAPALPEEPKEPKTPAFLLASVRAAHHAECRGIS